MPRIPSHDGVSLAAEERETGVSALFVHANGFCKEMWRPGGDLAGGIRGGAIAPRGAALVMAELLAPGTWSHLVLVEPIIFPGPYERAESHPLVIGAVRRRASFASPDDTRTAYAGRGPFSRRTAGAREVDVGHG